MMRGTFLLLLAAAAGAPDGPPLARPPAGGAPRRFSVDCGRSGSVATALRRSPGRALVLELDGTCREDVLIRRSDVTLRGVTRESTITGTIEVEGARGVVLAGLWVRESRRAGIVIGPSAEVEVRDVRVSGSAREGVLVRSRSTLRARGLTTESNATHGLRARGSCHLELSGRVEAHNNGGAGVVVDLASSLLGQDLELEASGNRIGFVVQQSAAQLTATTLRASRNSSIGVLVRDGSQLLLGSSRMEVAENGFSGVSVSTLSTIGNFFAQPSTLRASGNGNVGLYVNNGSLMIFNALTVELRQNHGFGLILDNATLSEVNGLVARDNRVSDVVFQYASRARVIGPNHLGLVVCDGSAQAEGIACAPPCALTEKILATARDVQFQKPVARDNESPPR